ncbi:MAG: hypothetical protein CL840_11050 [Crocinitomicaceae bacterium]|nr:hypothetical protein [Crocinitomicaceae bacterium]|tara:strand:+ start:6359 stop:10843 length:4485 start_codon:yes stop_codon:yes gene_type:complete
MDKKLIFLTIILFASYSVAFSHVGPTRGSRGGTKPNGNLAANCLPAAAANELNINNTRALIQTGGDMWWDFTSSQYEIPKNSGHTSLYAGALWMGGRDVSGQLKIAAQRFRGGGQDFWTGPLSTVNAEITQATCAEYDKHFLTTRIDIANYVAWFELGREDAANGTNKQAELFPDYAPPKILKEWPAHGRDYAPYNEDYNLAPFVDVDNDGEYNPDNGDYPAYDLNNEADCKTRIVNIYGDQNLWWVFNDKGNIHTETGSASIGMEIRAQAFAFATNDEINNMTFYNYELVNRSTFTLTETYFGQWVDADLGCSEDDYVGCDVQRGLGYCYNGDNYDEDCRGATGYGNIPPAIGVDFFQGPFQDADGKDNPLTLNYSEAIADSGIPYKGIGIGYGDGFIDNERFGMRKFLYHDRTKTFPLQDPVRGTEYYNYLRSLWRDGSRMVYGGNGHVSSGGTVEADYLFPGDTDPIGWGTGGIIQEPWTEATVPNPPGDRRFVQSAGPFVLQPGAVNNITVGVVWARATNGDNLSSVEALRRADDKTQALFDDCFKLINGPDAPDLLITELKNELILILENRVISNNYNESYIEQNAALIPPAEDSLSPEEEKEYKTYRFQGYKIYQVVDNTIGANDLDDIDKARLIAQVDIKDSITRIINYYKDNSLGGIFVPKMEVDGENKGIRKSFKITQDAFAQGDNKLINHKAYYFMAISYANNPNSGEIPYLGSRKAASGPIKSVKGIPHNIKFQNNGTILRSKYGDGVEVTRIEGAGNGGNSLELKQETIDEILTHGKADTLKYVKGAGPISIKVVDPIKVKPGDFTIWFQDSTSVGDLSNAYWQITGNQLKDTIRSTKSIAVGSETIIPELGISLTIGQSNKPGSKENRNTNQGILSVSYEFQDSSSQWLRGVPDRDGTTMLNWILSGSQATQDAPRSRINESDYDDWNFYQRDRGGNQAGVFDKVGAGLDAGQIWEQQLFGAVAPFRLTAHKTGNGPVPGYLNAIVQHQPVVAKDMRQNLWLYDYTTSGTGRNIAYNTTIDSINQLNYLSSINVVFTSDKSKWTRCPVFEMRDSLHESQGNSIRGQLRDAPSVDKDGNPATEGATASDNLNDPAYIGARGMGWFPGYAINLETGERLNMGFGEDSWLAAENGRDMIWNPTSQLTEGPLNEIRAGGMHIIYIFRNNEIEDEVFNPDLADLDNVLKPIPHYNFNQNKPENRMPSYDQGKFIYDKMKDVHGYLSKFSFSNDADLVHINNASAVFRAGMYVIFPLLATNHQLLETEATVKIRINRPYRNRGAGTDYVSYGKSLEIGEEYYVNAGPIKTYNATGDEAVYYSGQHFKATSTHWLPQYKNPLFGGNDSNNVVMKSINGGRPLYNFSTTDIAASYNNTGILPDLLSEIRVVPNPYYAYSQYESDKLDNRIKIINLPKTCNIRMYTVNGTLVRTLKKDDDSITYLEWDLKNQSRIPIASGIYVIHVEAPGIGEAILKWMGVMRPVDLDNF